VNGLSTEIASLELAELDLDDLKIQDIELVSGQNGLEALTFGHGMIELGASSNLSRPGSALTTCCSCACCTCCTCCCSE
jgi:hypothetical protein